MAAIMLVGIVAYFQLPVSALPEVDYPTIQVLTFYPGASRVSTRSSTFDSGMFFDVIASVRTGASAGLVFE